MRPFRAPPVAAAAVVVGAAIAATACDPMVREGDIGEVPGARPAADTAQVVDTPWGPVGPADRDLVVKVRLAGLWEIPVGREAARRAVRPATRRNLAEIARQHEQLDALDRRIAARLRVGLPNEPTAEQQGWIAEISGKSGLDYDRTAVLRLRLAHGRIYPAVAAVRGSTRNTLMRTFAQQCETFVATHMKLLEGTGLVGGAALPAMPDASGAPAPHPSGMPVPSAPPAGSAGG